MNCITATEKFGTPEYSLGSLLYNVNFRYLYNSQGSIYLRHKLNIVLQILINGDGRIVSRDELIEKVWSGNQYIGHKALTHSICKLRQYFSDLGESQVKIITVPKSGYSIVHVNELSPIKSIYS